MKKPLALLLHEKSMPGSKLGSKFEELDYRVLVLMDPAELATAADREKPMIVVADLTNRRGDVLTAVTALHRQESTAHVPVLAYTAREDEKLREAASKAGVKVLTTETTILQHLPQFVDQALHLD